MIRLKQATRLKDTKYVWEREREEMRDCLLIFFLLAFTRPKGYGISESNDLWKVNLLPAFQFQMLDVNRCETKQQ